MSIVREMFNQIIREIEASLDPLDIPKLEQIRRKVGVIGDKLSRLIQENEKAYQDAVSFERNVARPPISRKQSLQMGMVIARYIPMFVSSVDVLTKIAKLMDLLIQVMPTEPVDKRTIVEFLHSLIPDDGESISLEDDQSKIEKLASDWNSLYDEYDAKRAVNDMAAAEEVRLQIERKQDEIRTLFYGEMGNPVSSVNGERSVSVGE